jgi:hypothetical protein
MNKNKCTHRTKNKEKNDNITRVWQNGFPSLKSNAQKPLRQPPIRYKQVAETAIYILNLYRW